MADMQEVLVQLMTANPHANNQQLAEAMRQAIPGAKTTPASISSMKSRLKASIALGDGPEGFDASSISIPKAANVFDTLPDGEDDDETIAEAQERIDLRYKAMERLSRRLVGGSINSLIISGPPGLGKSFTVEEALEEEETSSEGRFQNVLLKGGDGLSADNSDDEEEEEEAEWKPSDEENQPRLYDQISGSITAVGLYQALWNTRNGGVVVLDDIDEVFRDEVSLNLLKAALDSKKKRMLSWRKEASWLDDYGIDKTFQFKGHVIFLTNVDFEAEIEKGNKLSEHFKALIDRSMYLCLTLRTKRDFMIRIRQVAGGEEGMICKSFGLTKEESDEILDFVADHQNEFYNLSLRLVNQIAQCRAIDPEGWESDILATKTRTR